MKGPRFDYYDWQGGREAMLRFGLDDAPVVIAALPLFEEANRTRTFVAGLLRALATRGVAGVLPDFPGQGESMAPLEDMTLAAMRAAYAAVVAAQTRRCFAVGFRSGALLDTTAMLAGRWHFAPQDGPALSRELTRLRSLPGEGRGDAKTLEIAGNLLSPSLLTELSAARIAYDARVIRLATDPASADRKIDAAPLWRRAEPGDDPAFAVLLANDIADWIATCGG